MDIGFKSLADQVRQITKQENFGEIISKLSTISEIIDNKMVTLCNDIYKDFHEEIQVCVHTLFIGISGDRLLLFLLCSSSKVGSTCNKITFS